MYKYVLPGQEFSTNMLKKKKKKPLGISQASFSEELKIFWRGEKLLRFLQDKYEDKTPILQRRAISTSLQS